MVFAVAPGRYYRFGGGIAIGDIFTDRYPVVAGPGDSPGKIKAIGAGMDEIMVFLHVFCVFLGRLFQLGIPTEGWSRRIAQIAGAIAPPRAQGVYFIKDFTGQDLVDRCRPTVPDTGSLHAGVVTRLAGSAKE